MKTKGSSYITDAFTKAYELEHLTSTIASILCDACMSEESRLEFVENDRNEAAAGALRAVARLANYIADDLENEV